VGEKFTRNTDTAKKLAERNEGSICGHSWAKVVTGERGVWLLFDAEIIVIYREQSPGGRTVWV